jgi:hypothetical protein
MSPYKEYFKELKIEDLGEVKMGDDRACRIQGYGVVTLNLNNGTTVDLHDVRYIPQLTKNLISLGLFEKAEYNVNLRNGKAKVIKGSMVVLSGSRTSNNLYLLDGFALGGAVSVVAERHDNLPMLWHRRLGHMSGQGLAELKKQEIVDSLSNCEFGFCEHCIMGK